MIFLIQYDRKLGRIVSLKTFEDGKRTMAENSRLELELALNRKGWRDEVVLLEAANKDALLLTHRRYFETARQIVASSGES